MKNIRKAVAAALIGVIAVASVGCNMVTKTESGIKKSPVAKFNNVTITKGDLDERMVSVLAQFKSQYGDNFLSNSTYKDQYVQQEKTMLDNMIIEKILLQKANDLKVAPKDDAEKKTLTDNKMAELKKNYTEDQIKQSGFTGYTDPKLISYAGDIAIMDKVYAAITKDVTVDDKAVSDYYAANPLQFTEKPDQIHVAHILVATEDAAKKVKDRLDKGEDFAKVAKEVSTDTGSKDNGGDLGTVPYLNSGLDTDFMTAATALKDGAISGPVKTQFGYHIIKCIKNETYPVKKLDAVKDDIKKQLLADAQSKKYSDTITQWKTDAKITYYDNNL
ncbi:peptidylprolyl isomerase [Candidatus Clostridium radicumherbarum]|uniref:peptidylprolyl isomerase n=1 Tax=Candidatus Clostridium radicumherbarum TaxID=3381662 RepID=A0ABW8U0B1_9CLOT